VLDAGSYSATSTTLFQLFLLKLPSELPINVSLLQFGEIEQGLGHCGSDTLAPVFERIRTQYPLVFIDSSTILNEPEAISGIRIADYTFLVITSGKVPAKAGIRTKQLIEANDGKIAGVILNKVKYEIPQWLYRFI